MQLTNLKNTYAKRSSFYKVAFTLAEVLITLGIIGIVAEMTIPTLIQNVNEQQYIVKTKKFYSTFAQATQSMTLNNSGSIWDNSSTDSKVLSENMFNEYRKYFKFVKEGIDSDLRGSDWRFYGYKSSTIVFTNNPNRYGAILGDGTYVYFYSVKDCNLVISTEYNMCGQTIVDINGKSKPNMFGKDVQVFEVLKRNDGIYKIEPAGQIRTTLTCDVGSTTQTSSYGCTSYIILGKELPK